MKHETISNEQLVRLAFSKGIKIHITLNDGSWRNGMVQEVTADFFMLEDKENGLEPFFYIQLNNVEPFMEDVR